MIALFEIAGFELTQTAKQTGEIVLEAVSTKGQMSCPDCQQPSQSIHSYYTRHPNDLPVFDQAVHWQLRVML